MTGTRRLAGDGVALALVPGFALRPTLASWATEHGISDQRAYYIQVSGIAHPVTVDDYAAYARVQRGDRAAALAERGHRALILDERGHRLSSGAPAPVAYETGGIGLPGMAAGDRVYILDRLGLADAARAAAIAMGCPPLDRLRVAITGPLTVDRFVANLAVAPALTALRFPSDPHAAVAELCGGASVVKPPVTGIDERRTRHAAVGEEPEPR